MNTLAEEEIRIRRFPGIAFRGPDQDRRAWLRGNAFDIWELIIGYRDFGSVKRVVESSHISEPQLRLALAYYAAYPEEIDRAITANEMTPEQAAVLFPFSSQGLTVKVPHSWGI